MPSRRRTPSWSRSTARGSGTATTRCSGTSSSASSAGPSPTRSRSSSCDAADWFQANGSPAMAVEYLLSTAERERSAQLVAELVPVTYSAGQISTVQRWMASLGSPRSGPTHRWQSWPAGSQPSSATRADAQRWAAVVDEVSFAEVPEGGPASFASSRAMLRAMMCPAGPEQMMADAELAGAQETPSSLWRDTALYSLAEAHLLAGDVDRAAAAFEEATTVGQALGNTDPVVSCTSELAIIAMDAGRWDEAADRLEIALGIIEDHQMHDYAISVLAFAAAARLAVHNADLAEADRRLTQGMRCSPAVHVRGPVPGGPGPTTARQGAHHTR